MPTCKGGINMKRLSKKLIALVMAMTMVLAMGVTSFAATPNADGKYPINVVVTDKNNQTVSYPVTLTPNQSLYTQAEGETIENYGTATAFDAVLATGKVNFATDTETVQYLNTTTWQPINRWGKAINAFDGQAGTSTQLENGKTEYGYWALYISEDGETYDYADEYATAYLAEDIEAVKLVWETMIY